MLFSRIKYSKREEKFKRKEKEKEKKATVK
jgi:hypothetical protein